MVKLCGGKFSLVKQGFGRMIRRAVEPLGSVTKRVCFSMPVCITLVQLFLLSSAVKYFANSLWQRESD